VFEDGLRLLGWFVYMPDWGRDEGVKWVFEGFYFYMRIMLLLERPIS
jgi:hypothetical protein